MRETRSFGSVPCSIGTALLASLAREDLDDVGGVDTN
jgi:hypothetical protein